MTISPPTAPRASILPFINLSIALFWYLSRRRAHISSKEFIGRADIQEWQKEKKSKNQRISAISVHCPPRSTTIIRELVFSINTIPNDCLQHCKHAFRCASSLSLRGFLSCWRIPLEMSGYRVAWSIRAQNILLYIPVYVYSCSSITQGVRALYSPGRFSSAIFFTLLYRPSLSVRQQQHGCLYASGALTGHPHARAL